MMNLWLRYSEVYFTFSSKFFRCNWCWSSSSPWPWFSSLVLSRISGKCSDILESVLIFNTKAVCQSLRSVIPIYMFAMQASKLGLLRHPADRAQTSNGRGGGSFVISISGESLSKKRVKSSTDKTRWRFPSLADQPPVAQVCQLFSSPRRGKSGEDQMFESVKVWTLKKTVKSGEGLLKNPFLCRPNKRNGLHSSCVSVWWLFSQCPFELVTGGEC